MKPVRRIAFNPWVSRAIIGTWVLWSGMFLCLLSPTVEASQVESRHHPAVMDQADVAAMLTHCLESTDDGEGMTCKLEVNGPLVQPDLIKVAVVNSALLFQSLDFIEPATSIVARTVTEHLHRKDIYLLFCTFLK